MIASASGRTSTSRALGLALSLALALCASSACSSSKSKETPEQKIEAGLAAYQQEIHRVVKDSARAKQLVELAAEFQAVVNQAALSFHVYHLQLAELNRNYDATLAEFEAVFDRHDAQSAELLEKTGAIRARIAELTTESEWAALRSVRIDEWQDDLTLLQASN